ncbi:hypothetical protein N9344_00640, partial [bacterium]|nr:hypothetical protein [bacterium]
MYDISFRYIMKYFGLSFLLTILFIGTLFSQDKLSSKDENLMLEQAEYLYGDENVKNYAKALELFEKLEKNKPNDPYYKLMIGICYSHFPEKKELAIEKLKEVKELNPDFVEVNFQLGNAYALNHQFDKAVEMYELYLVNELDEKLEDRARQNILYCENAKLLIKDSVEVNIVNIGYPVNSEFSEYVPIITPNEGVMIYTSRGERSKGGKRDHTGKESDDGVYYEDIMISYKFKGEWLEPESIGGKINTTGHDASVALSVDGSQLFIYKSTKKDNGDLYVSHLEGDEWSQPERLKGDVNSPFWEGSATLSSGGNVLYFTSDRDGGYGGRDIYSAELMSDDTWGNVKNLGPTVNTRYDDDSPFIHPDRKTLYFSSQGHNSMGGYDIFYTYLGGDGWETPTNVGYPVNTINDDRFYVLSADAKTGYYSTAGRSKEGTHDIYAVTPGHLGKKPILALIVGVVSANDEPINADVTVTNTTTNKIEGKYKSNELTGKYMMALTPGDKYKIAIEVEGYEATYSYIDVESLETYVQVEHDFKLYSPDYKKGEVKTSVVNDENELQGKIDKQIEKYKQESTAEGYNAMVYQSIIDKHGEKEVEGIGYFVDLKNVDVNTIDTEKYPIIDKVLPNGDVQKVVGVYSNLLKAEVARKNLMKENKQFPKLEVKVNDNGTEQTIKQHYSSEYTKKEYDETTDMHDKLTGEDDKSVVEVGNGKGTAYELEDDNEIDISTQDGLKDAKAETINGLSFKLEISSVSSEDEFKLGYLEKYGKINTKKYPDGTIK